MNDTQTESAQTFTPGTATDTVRGDTRTVAVIGASGYTGAELLRLIAGHPNLELVAATSSSQPATRLDRIHPHLRGAPEAMRSLKTVPHDDALGLDVDVAILAVPHGRGMQVAPGFVERGIRVIDLSADFRLRDPAAYPQWYGHEHNAPDLLAESAYGIAELHRDEYSGARIVSGAGCIATAGILALRPLLANGLIDPQHIVIDAKIGSSASGATANAASHHVDRQRAIRPYGLTGHRHTAEIQQECTIDGTAPRVALSTHAVELVRGVFVTVQGFLNEEHADVQDREIWQAYRGAYGSEPFVRIVKERTGIHRAPDPRLLAGTNVAEVGFERDPQMPRVVATCALDNITKGAAGAAIQNLNIAMGWDETTALPTIGLYPFA